MTEKRKTLYDVKTTSTLNLTQQKNKSDEKDSSDSTKKIKKHPE